LSQFPTTPGDTLLKKALVYIAVLAFSLFAHSGEAERTALKVTIAVNGMMKSKSGAT
jgi:hypothetical protein